MQTAFSPNSISGAVSFLAALSVATERLVEIIKGSIPPLNNQAKNPTLEGFRQATLHVLAALCGLVTAYMAQASLQGILPGNWSPWGSYCVIGLLVSGGSGFWNSILSYAKASKDIQEANAPGNKTSAA